MSQLNIVQSLLQNNIRENKKVFFFKTICAICYAIFLFIIDQIYNFEVLPFYFLALLITSLIVNKSISKVIPRRNINDFDYYCFSLPLTYKQKILLSIGQGLFNNFYVHICLFYLAYAFFGESVIHQDLYKQLLVGFIIILQLPLAYMVTPHTNFKDKIGYAKLYKKPSILLLNIPSFILIVLIGIINILAIWHIFNGAFNVEFTLEEVPFVFVLLFFDVLIYMSIKDGAKTVNEHKVFRFVKTSFVSQLKYNSFILSSLVAIHIMIVFGALSMANNNVNAFSIASFYKLVDKPKAISLLQSDINEFFSYFRKGMPEDKHLTWLNDRYIVNSIIENDRKNVLVSLFGEASHDYDALICDKMNVSKCERNFLLNLALKVNSRNISSYLLMNTSYTSSSFDKNKAIYDAAKDCNGRAVASLLESGAIPSVDKFEKNKDVYDVLSTSSSGKCRSALRYLLKSKKVPPT